MLRLIVAFRSAKGIHSQRGLPAATKVLHPYSPRGATINSGIVIQGGVPFRGAKDSHVGVGGSGGFELCADVPHAIIT
jgi:hypothetical protein